MQALKNKVFGILLILCFVTPAVTTFVFLKYQKKQVKREVKRKIIAGIDKEELVLLKFTKKEQQAELKWEHSKEFEYKGEMYDVVETKVIGDTTYYWLWWDHEETKLNKQLSKLVSFTIGNNPKNQENQKRLNKFFKSLYFTEKDKEKESPIFLEVKNNYCFVKNFYHSIFISPPAPPPKKS